MPHQNMRKIFHDSHKNSLPPKEAVFYLLFPNFLRQRGRS